MSLQNLLSDDALLEEVFAIYLKLPVFPVPLEFCLLNGTSCLVEPSRSSLKVWKDPVIQGAIFEWVESHRLPFFVKSRVYVEYCFCRQLMKRKSVTITYYQFKCFQSRLVDTKGDVHLELWLSLKQLFPPTYTDDTVANHFDFDRLTVIRRLCGSSFTELKMPLFPVYSDPLSKVKWCEYVLCQLMQRLSDYWWLRFFTESHSMQESTQSTNETSHFLAVLQLEHSVGRPFLDFLHREAVDDEVIQYHFREDINGILQQKTNFEFQRAIINCVNKYSSKTFQVFGLSKALELIHDLHDNDDTSRQLLHDIEERLMFNLRRKWIPFIHNDYESFCRCFPPNILFQLLPTSMFPSPDPITDVLLPTSEQTCYKRKVKFRRRKPEVTLSMADLIRTPLATLPNPRALEDFKAFLEDLHGIDSQEYAALEIWLAILVHSKVPKGSKNGHARKIFQSFLSSNAKLPFVWSKKSEKPVPRRPPSPVLEDLQTQAFQNFADDLVVFLKIIHGDSAQSSTRPNTDMPLFETTLEGDDVTFKDLNHVGKKLHQFMFNNITIKSHRMSFLLRKISALVDRYLDTATPPWVKIAISNEMAHDLTEVVSLLVTDPDSETIDLAMELFTKSKAAVLSHLTQFWVEFNRMVTDSPSRSTVSTTGSSRSSANSKSSSTRTLYPPTPPPPPSDGRSSSVLSFSRQEGLQWR